MKIFPSFSSQHPDGGAISDAFHGADGTCRIASSQPQVDPGRLLLARAIDELIEEAQMRAKARIFRPPGF
jgi:hypothetical protein